MPLNAGDVVRTAVRFADTQGNDHVNVWHWEASAAISDADAAIRAAIATWVENSYSALSANLSNLITELDVKVDVVDFVGGVITVIRSLGVEPFTLTTAPTAGADPMPPGVAALLKLLTGIGRVYGRKFIGMFTETSQINGILAAAFQTNLGTLGAAVLGGIGGLTGGVLNGGVLSEKLTSFVQFTGYDVSDVVSYQRRRRQGSGS